MALRHKLSVVGDTHRRFTGHKAVVLVVRDNGSAVGETGRGVVGDTYRDGIAGTVCTCSQSGTPRPSAHTWRLRVACVSFVLIWLYGRQFSRSDGSSCVT